jgi:hypothetical protein
MTDATVDLFAGKTVTTWKPEKPLPDPQTHAIRLSLDSYGDDTDFNAYFSAFLKLDGIADIEALLIGDWGEPYDISPKEVIKGLIDQRTKLAKLTALFLGDMDSEICEVSWIQQTDLSPIFEAFPKLQTLKTRGSDGLSLGRMKLPQLYTLIMESGGLGVAILNQIAHGETPQLNHLELWLGSYEYGCDITPEQLTHFLSELHKFPKLTSLGLCNFEASDELARVISETGLPASITRLDLSKGNLSDKGAQYLLEAGDRLKQLQTLDLHYHYLSTAMMERLSKLPIQVDVSNQQIGEEYDGETYRYIFLSE